MSITPPTAKLITGGFALRGVLMTTLRTVLVRMVSTAIIGVSQVPTGGGSPDRTVYSNAYNVELDGSVGTVDLFGIHWESCGNNYFSIIDMTPT